MSKNRRETLFTNEPPWPSAKVDWQKKIAVDLLGNKTGTYWQPRVTCAQCDRKTVDVIFRYGVKLCPSCFEKIEGLELAAFHQKESATR